MEAVVDFVTRGVEVAVLIADQQLGASRAVELLVRLHEVVPTAKRVMLVQRGDWSATHPVVSAVALGQVDHHLFSPWRPLERILYPAVSEVLAEWDKSQDATEVPVRIVGQASSTRSHGLRDALTRVSVPYWFYEDTSTAGLQLLAEAGAEGTRLPVVGPTLEVLVGVRVFYGDGHCSAPHALGDQHARSLRCRRCTLSLH
jgi:thioredoxin reductase (NADPH)